MTTLTFTLMAVLQVSSPTSSQTWHHPQNWKYTMHYNAAKGKPSHGHRQYA